MVKYYRKRKSVKKSTATVKPSLYKAIAKISKSQALKVAETKNAVVASIGNGINHNGDGVHMGMPKLILPNILHTTQGLGDDKGTSQNRIGDAIFPIGSKLMFQVRLPVDRPNTTIKVWIVKYAPLISNVLGAPNFLTMNAVANNLMLDSVDTEQFTVVKTMIFKATNTFWVGTNGQSKECTIHRSVWLPFPKRQYTYNGDDSSHGKYHNYGIFAGAYDTSTTLRTDTIGYLDVSSLLYFKDP